MKAVIYARFSPQPNGSKSESIETQIDRCRAYCDSCGYEVAEIYADRGKSGKTTNNRPALRGALRHARRERAVLVVYSLSRLARDTRDALDILETLRRSKANLAMLDLRLDTTSAIGKAMFQFSAVLAELEREQTAERTSDAMRRRQADGQRMSAQIPFGYQEDPDSPLVKKKEESKRARHERLIPEPAEQAIVRLILNKRRAGIALRQIMRDLTAAGIPCRGGTRWHRSTIARILKREQLTSEETP